MESTMTLASSNQSGVADTREPESLRLLYVTQSMPYSKVETFLIDEALELRAQTESFLIVPRSPGRKIVNADALPLKHNVIRRQLLGPSVLRAALAEFLRQPLRTLRALLLLNGSESLMVMVKNIAVLPKALWIARLARHRDISHIHAHWGWTCSTMAMIASSLCGVPWSLTLHRGDIEVPNLLANKTASASFTRFISESGRTMTREVIAPHRTRRECVVHMGVVLPTHRPPTRPSRLLPTLVCPASLIPVKGHRYLIEAVAIARNDGVGCTLLIAGDGPMRKDLDHLIQQLDVSETVKFLGRVPHHVLLTMYSRGQVDVVVLPSVDLGNHLHEGIPVSLIEAMAHWIPVISTNTGGVPELLRGGAGVIVPDKNPGALANQIEALAQSPRLRRRIGESGRARIEEEYAVSQTVKQLLALLRGTTY